MKTAAPEPSFSNSPKLPAPHSPGIDLVYLDPPYEAQAEYESTLSFLGSARGRQILTPDAIVIAEHASKGKHKLAARYGALEHYRLLKQGDAALSFYQLQILPPPIELSS